MLFLPLFICAQYQGTDSLKLALKNAKHDTARCNILFALIEAESDDNIWPKYNEQLKLIAEKQISHGGLLNKFFWKHLAAALNNIGFLANSQGDISKSLDYFHRSLKIREDIKDKRGMAESINNIGAIFKKQGELQKALNYYYKGLAIYNEIGNKEGIATAYNNIAGIYDTEDDLDNALEYYNNSLKLREELGDLSGVALACNNIGYIHYRKNESKKALEFFEKSLKMSEDIGDQNGIANALCNVAVAEAGFGKTAKALLHANRAMTIARDLGFPENIKSSAQSLKKTFQKQNKYKEAFEMYELEIKMGDSINNQETRNASVKKEMQYVYEKKEMKAKAEQDKKDLITAEQLKQKESERNYFIIGFAMVIFLALLIFRSFRQKQKANALITHQKHLVEEKQKEILDSIHYAKRIQSALMASEANIEKILIKLQSNI